MTIQSTIIALRSPELTTFFKIFPFLVSDTFYIAVIALGYWTFRNPRVFWKLGFLVPFSTLLTALLKSVFMHDRPEAALHLVTITDKSSGFPSGDVLVSVVFWGMLALHFRSKALCVFSALIILCIMLSRIYLGVHTIDQVCGGLLFGALILALSQSSEGQKMFNDWQNGRTTSYWVLCALISLAYVAIAPEISLLVLVVVGVLIGYGVGAPLAGRYMATRTGNSRFVLAFVGLASFFAINKIFPKIHFEKISWIDGFIVLKYILISLVMSVFIPMMTLKMTKNKP
jgi:hypothetical protein